MKRTICSIAVLGALGAMPLSANAQYYGGPVYYQPQVYLGGGVGYNRLDGQPFGESNSSNDGFGDSHATWKAFAGLQFNPMVALEGQYIDFGAHNDNSDNVQAHGVSTDLVLRAPIAPGIMPFAKVGALFWTSDGLFTSNGTPAGTGFNQTGTDLTWGGGVDFRVARNVELRAEYERFRLADAHVDNATIGLKLNF